jgi:hypothetical protein
MYLCPSRDNTTLTTDEHPCLRWDSIQHSQQACGRGPTPITAWPLGPAQIFLITFTEFFTLSHCTSLRAAWSLTEPLHTPLSQTKPFIFTRTLVSG